MDSRRSMRRSTLSTDLYTMLLSSKPLIYHKCTAQTPIYHKCTAQTPYLL